MKCDVKTAGTCCVSGSLSHDNLKMPFYPFSGLDFFFSRTGVELPPCAINYPTTCLNPHKAAYLALDLLSAWVLAS